MSRELPPLAPAPVPPDPPREPREVDPDAPRVAPGSAFDLGIPPEEARVLLIPVPWEATVSGGTGTIDGPGATLAASAEIDLHDMAAGEAWRGGIAALSEPAGLRERSREAARLAARAREGDSAAASRVDGLAAELWSWLEDAVGRTLASGRLPLVLGGEHGLSPGAFRAAARHAPGLGILHVDAHADLRESYEGMRSSHASALARALELPGVARVVQVGLRDVSREEVLVARDAGTRVRWFDEVTIAGRVLAGEPFAEIAREAVASLPGTAWVSLDVDGLDPSLCPGTGTPVPGGLSFREISFLLGEIVRSGRRLLGADVVEVGPGPWDGQVAARLVYRLAGWATAAAR